MTKPPRYVAYGGAPIGSKIRWDWMREQLSRGDVKLPSNEDMLRDLTAPKPGKSDQNIVIEPKYKFEIFDEASEFSPKVFDEMTKLAVREAARELDDQIRDCLGRWVSELEPVTVFQQEHFIGLGYGFDGVVYVKARLRTPRTMWWHPQPPVWP